MRKKSVVLGEYQAKLAEQKSILDKGASATSEEIAQAKQLETAIDALETELKSITDYEALQKKNASRSAVFAGPSGDSDDDIERPELGTGRNSRGDAPDREDRLVQASRTSREHAFLGSPKEAARKAYRFGMFFLASVAQNPNAQRYCKEHGITVAKAHEEGINSTGGYLVPEEFEADMIVLREEYGVFRRLAKNSRMRADTKSVPRRAGGLTAYFVGEGGGITESKKGWNRVTLTAKKLAVLAIYSNELGEDAVIDIGNDLADEIAYAFAQMEDECGFNGDGTSPYGRIMGCCPTILGVDPTPANIKGLYTTAAGVTTLAQLVLGDWSAVKKLLPRYARKNACWYVNQSVWDESMERLMLAAGGVTAAEVSMGANEDKFMGKRVEIAQALPDTPAPGAIFALFGDLRLAALFGDRRQMTLAVSEHVNFGEDEIAIRGTERFDINVHDVGDTTKAGPLVAIRLSAS